MFELNEVKEALDKFVNEIYQGLRVPEFKIGDYYAAAPAVLFLLLLICLVEL